MGFMRKMKNLKTVHIYTYVLKHL